MKSFRKKLLAALCAVIIGIALVVITPVPRDAQASGTALLLQAWSQAQKFLTNYITDAINNKLAESLANTVLGQYLPQMQEAWQLYSRERMMAEIEKARQDTELANAEQAQRHTDTIETERLDAVKRRILPESACQQLTGDTMAAQLKAAANQPLSASSFWSGGGGGRTPPRVPTDGEGTPLELIEEAMRRDLTNAEGSLCEKGIVECNMILFDERMKKFCSPDEHNGALEQTCENTNPDRVDLDINASVLTGCYTIRKDDLDAVLQMVRYMLPLKNPLPQNTSTDPEMMMVNLDRTKEAACNDAKYDYIRRLVAMHTEAGFCNMIPGLDMKGFATIIHEKAGTPVSEIYRPVSGQGRPCPSIAEMECVTRYYQYSDALFTEFCGEGDKCELALTKHLNQTQFELKMLEKARLMMTASCGD